MSHKWDPNRYYFSNTVDLTVMAMMKYFKLHRAAELVRHHQMQFRVIPMRTLVWVGVIILSARDQHILSPTDRARFSHKRAHWRTTIFQFLFLLFGFVQYKAKLKRRSWLNGYCCRLFGLVWLCFMAYQPLLQI